MNETTFAADLTEAREDATRLRQEIRTLRKAKAERGAITAVRIQLRSADDWLWQTRFAAWSLENGDDDQRKAERVPF